MTRLILDTDLRQKLRNLTEPLELCDESGQVLAHLTPAIRLPHSETTKPLIGRDELLRRKQARKGHTAQRQRFRGGPLTWAVLIRSMGVGSDLSTVSRLDRIATQEAEASGSNRAGFPVDPRVGGLHFPVFVVQILTHEGSFKKTAGETWK